MEGKAPIGSDRSGFATVQTEDHQMKLADVMFKTSKNLFLSTMCSRAIDNIVAGYCLCDKFSLHYFRQQLDKIMEEACQEVYNNASSGSEGP